MATAGDFPALLRERARENRRRIVFPEAADPRVQAAILQLDAERIVEAVAVLDPARRNADGAIHALGVETLDPATDPRHERLADDLFRARSAKGLSREQAQSLAQRPLYFADHLVAEGEADGCVAGAVHTTADVLRAALWLVGPAPGVSTVSSAFYMVCRAFRGEETDVLTFTANICSARRYRHGSSPRPPEHCRGRTRCGHALVFNQGKRRTRIGYARSGRRGARTPARSRTGRGR